MAEFLMNAFSLKEGPNCFGRELRPIITPNRTGGPAGLDLVVQLECLSTGLAKGLLHHAAECFAEVNGL